MHRTIRKDHRYRVVVLTVMESLLKTLPAILQVAGDAPEVVEAACIAAWKHAAGEGLRDHAVPLSFNNNTLVIGVADSTWQQQLQSLSSQLLARINSILGKPLVSQLEFRVTPELMPNRKSRT